MNKLEFKNGSVVEPLDCGNNQRSTRGNKQLQWIEFMRYYEAHPYKFYKRYSFVDELKLYQRVIIYWYCIKDSISNKFHMVFVRVYFKLIRIILYGFRGKGRE